MSFATGDFTELRRTKVEVETQRLSQSVVKRRIPRKIINIKPLNLNKIRKEAEECDTTDGEQKDEENCISDYNDAPLADISNKEGERSELTTSVLKKAECGKENDSFDLNFSALSLVTPVKQIESVYETPRANKQSTTDKKQAAKFNNFVTPSVNKLKPMKIQYSASKAVCLNSARGHMNMLISPVIESKEETDTVNLVPEIPLETIKVKNVDYLVLNMLGKGGSSEVFACFSLMQKKHVAIKCVKLQNQANAKGYINEVKLLHQLQNCDKIIRMYDYEILENEKKLLVVLERGGEDLSTIFKSVAAQNSHMPFYMLLFYWMEMLHAVKQMHSHGVIHADLKPANFIKANSGLKLIDFGIASSVQIDMTSVFKTTPEGSCNYISPEALNQDATTNSSSPTSGSAKYKIHFKSDVWSLGCILYQLVYMKTPFHHIHHLWSKLAYIVNPNHVIEFPHVDWVPPKLIDTMKNCLQYNVKSRPSVDELINLYENFWCQNCFSH